MSGKRTGIKQLRLVTVASPAVAGPEEPEATPARMGCDALPQSDIG